MMLKSIQAYFPTENEAEAVKALLVSYETEKVEVSRLEGNGLNETVPVAAIGQPDAILTAGVNNGFHGGVVIGGTDLDTDSKHNYKYVLSTKVKNEDYDEIVDLIHENLGELK